MDQEQIHIIQVELAQTLVETGNRPVVALKLAIQLGGDKEFLTREATIAYALAHTPLVAIAEGGVDVPVAGGDGRHKHRRNHVVLERSRAQADLGDGIAVVEG